MNVLIAGNGLAGTIAAKTLRELDTSVGIEIRARERHPYYPRPNLIEYVAGGLSRERLFGFPPGWYEAHKISLRLGSPVSRVLPAERAAIAGDGERVAYDALLLANGALPSRLPIKGLDKPGVFTLRTLDDADAIVAYIAAHPDVAVIGGGLLGLEIARALRSRGARVEVFEVFDWLLPRQLDPAAGAILKAQIEARGIRVRLGVATEEVAGDGGVRGLRLKGGEEIPAGAAVVAAGIVPDAELAKEAGLAVERGIVVDDLLRTSAPAIFAAGDIAQHAGRIYGIIPAAYAQARAVAAAILGRGQAYHGTVPSTTLKVVGLAMASAGEINPPPQGYEEIVAARPEQGIYKKIVLKDGKLAGAIWLGTKAGAEAVTHAVTKGLAVGPWAPEILEDGFDFGRLA